ncbi:unnamed protein product [Symbiodinium microadriaticum]|nr:unnamed protein product [Symbiodinium microadriaticum]
MDHAVRHASSNRRERAFSASPTPARNALSSTPDSAETVMGAGGGREWTPSVRGRPEVLSRASFQQWQDERRQESWDDQWSSWSSWQSQGTSWEDPWSAYLDRRRPSWRRQRAYDMYENWTAEEEDDGDDPPPTPPGSAVPFPRLLSRRENSPVPKEPPPPSRLFPERPELTAPAPGDLRASRLPAQGSNSYGKDSKQGDTGGSGGFLRLHSSFPPEFKAKPGESWKDYWRSVEFWLASEGANLPASVRGARLMQSMKERAGKIVAHLSVSDVAAEDGVQRIREEMEKSPIIRLLEHKEVDKTRKKFMRLCRHPRESLESFINRASIYRHENDRCQNYRVGTKFYLGHLLDAAKLTNKDEALVKTAAGGLHDENKVVNAMLELAEQLEGKPGYPIGRGEPNLHDDDEYLFQKGRDKDRDEPAARVSKPFMRGGRGRDGKFRSNHKLARKWKQVFHAILEDDEDQGSSEEEPSSVEEKGTSPDEQDETPEREDDGSSGSSELPAEVYAQEYKAKKKVNEIRQMRQFFQKGTNPDKTKAWVREQQKKEPCFLCGRLGHWSQECPDRARSSGRKPHAVNVVAGNFTDDRGQWDLLESMAGYMSVRGESFEVSSSDCFVVLGPRPVCHQSSLLDHESFWAMRELHSSLILDIGCMKSVAGTKWTNQHINRLRGLGRWMKAIKEKESFRFGDGHELCSEFAFIFEATIMGIRVLLRISVVPGDCPPLLSKPACTQLGLVIDTENHTVSSRKLKVSKYGLTQTYGGHYALPIAEFTDDMSPMHVVCESTRVRQPLQCVSDTTTIFMFRLCLMVKRRDGNDTKTSETRGRHPEHHRLNAGDSDPDYTTALKENLGEWSAVEVEEETEPEEAKGPPRRPKSIIKGNFAARTAFKVRSKSAEKARGTRTPERQRQRTPSRPRSSAARPSRAMASTSSEAPGTPASVTSATIASLRAQAAELEEQIWPHMDPTSIHTEGSKATKAYWIARVAVLEEELGYCKSGPTAMEEDADKPTGNGETGLEETEGEEVINLEPPPARSEPPAGGRRSSATPTPKSAPKTTRTKVEKVKALTDHAAPFPTLSTRFSDDLVVNAMISLQSGKRSCG